MPITAEDVGRALVILSLVFAFAALIRRSSRLLRALFIPTAVIGGFVILALGPDGMGRITGGNGAFSAEMLGIWKALPGLLINVMCTSLLLGERLPPLGSVWKVSSSHAILASIMSAGQFAVGSIVVLLVLVPVFGLNPKAGALIEMSFAGGHGTLAGLTPVLVEYGAEELLELGLGLATVGMLTGILIGTALVNYATASPGIPIARQQRTSPEEDYDIDYHLPGPDDEPIDEQRGMIQVTTAAVFIGVSIAVGFALLQAFRMTFALFGSRFFDNFPLFPFTILGGVIVQLCAVRFHYEHSINRLAVEGLGGLAIDGIVICAIGTLSLAALGSQLGPLIVLAAASVAWSAFVTLVISRRVFPRHWFEHGLAEFGESQGNVATGFVMVDMVDPERTTDVVRAYSYRQLITRPVLGGGFLTALSVPLIASWGLPLFTIVSATVTVVLTIWGMRRQVAVGSPGRLPAGSGPRVR